MNPSASAPLPEESGGPGPSLTGRYWRYRDADDRQVARLVQMSGLPEVLARVVVGRGIDPDEAEAWLDPRLDRDLPDPASLAGMEEAAGRFADAVAAGRRIAVFGDYDVDGSTSAALLARYLAEVAEPPLVRIPDRLKDGYGPTPAAMEKFREEGAELVVTVDCGTTAHDAFARARELGLDAVILDHHVPEERLPEAALVNPFRPDDTSELGMLAAVGITFLFVGAVHRLLRARGWFEERPEPDLRQWLDMVALGTVCDMAPLTGPNRVIVRRGLQVMALRENPGLRALADVARIQDPPDVFHAGFVFGPRINAAGRVGESRLGLDLLVTEDEDEAERIALQLDALNRERQEVEAGILDEAAPQAKELADAGAPVLVVVGDGWHPGVAGIVASRLVERFHRPSVVIGRDGTEARGSARSVSRFDIGGLVLRARDEGLLHHGGGHRMAAGLALDAARLDELTAFLVREGGRLAGDEVFRPSLAIDGVLAASGVTVDLGLEIARAGPFGIGNPTPRFAFPGVRPVYAQTVGMGHVRCVLADETRGRVKGIAFRAADTPLGDALLRGDPLDVAGRLRVSMWNDRDRAEVHIDDAIDPAASP